MLEQLYNSKRRIPKLKKTCSRCASLKKKCDSEKPSCSRCVRNNMSCFYDFAKKTGKRKVPSTERKQLTKKPYFTEVEQNVLLSLFHPSLFKEKQLTQAFSKLKESESRTWRFIQNTSNVFASGYTQFVSAPFPRGDIVGAAILVLALKLHFAKNLPFSSLTEDQFSKFNEIVNSSKINVADIQRRLINTVAVPDIEYSVDIGVKFFCFEDKFLYPLPENLAPGKGFCRIYWNHSGHRFNNRVSPNFEVNSQFRSDFGFDEHFLNEEVGNSVLSFLQYGTSVLSLLTTEDVVQSYIRANFFQVQKLKHAEKCLTTKTWDLKTPCSMILSLHTATGEWKPFQVNGLSRELMTKNYYLGEIRLYFTPCEI
eukprot:snap_masked-scaffold_5-processed-gene-20.66-mRNA-1 protein AED:1.00 eAED:1.00 QI:0/-1/0/0/-1/1/1/0/367